MRPTVPVLCQRTDVVLLCALTQKRESMKERPRQDSNLRLRLRRPTLYPLSYEGGVSTTGPGHDSEPSHSGPTQWVAFHLHGRRGSIGWCVALPVLRAVAELVRDVVRVVALA